MEYVRNCEIKEGIVFPEGMRRIALGVEYAGADLKGFQKQASTPDTVQEALERALSYIAQEEILLVCAGRTDAGVHATGQVVHFDTLAERPEKAWVKGANTKLPDSVRICWAQQQSEQFHARFSAFSRTYRYVFHCAPVRSAVLAKQVTYSSYELDFLAMKEASQVLLGEHDFSAFRSAQCQAFNPVRNIDAITWCRQGALVVMEIRANAFLHHMVRNIVGTLLEIGKGAKDRAWLEWVLASKNRCNAGPTAAPWGLYLIDVAYPESFALPQRSLGPVFFDWNDHRTL